MPQCLVGVEHHLAKQALQAPPLVGDGRVLELGRQQIEAAQEVEDRVDAGASAEFGLARQPGQEHANQAGHRFEPLGIAPEPEEIVGNAAREFRDRAEFNRRPDGQPRLALAQPMLSDNPRVLAAAAQLHRHDQRLAPGGHASQPAGQHAVGGAVPCREHAQHDVTRFETAMGLDGAVERSTCSWATNCAGRASIRSASARRALGAHAWPGTRRAARTAGTSA